MANGATFIGKHGVTTDLRGAHAVFDLNARHYIVSIQRVYRDEVCGCTLLETRHLNGEAAPTICLSFVNILSRN